jgi:hypothetical protein
MSFDCLQMLDFTSISEFSRTHCIAICAFLVPANLFATLLTMGLIVLQKPRRRILRSIGIAGLMAGLMAGHVLTWFLVGIVMPPTFILSALALTCGLINLWAWFGQNQMANLLVAVVKFCTKVDLPLSAQNE